MSERNKRLVKDAYIEIAKTKEATPTINQIFTYLKETRQGILKEEVMAALNKLTLDNEMEAVNIVTSRGWAQKIYRPKKRD